MPSYELRLRGSFDKGAVISIMDGLRECFSETNEGASVYSQDKKRGIIHVDDVSSRRALDEALKKHTPSGVRLEIYDRPESALPPEEKARFYDLRRQLEEEEKRAEKLRDELKAAEGRLRYEEDARRALVEIKGEQEERLASLEKTSAELGKEYADLVSSMSDRRSAGKINVIKAAPKIKEYDERFDKVLSSSEHYAVSDALRIAGGSLVEYANRILEPKGIIISTEEELDGLTTTPDASEKEQRDRAAEELKFLESLLIGSSGAPKHLVMKLAGAVDRAGAEEIVKKYDSRLAASGDVGKIRTFYQRAKEIETAVNSVKSEGGSVPFFITNSQDETSHLIEVLAPAGLAAGYVSGLIAKRVEGAAKNLPVDAAVGRPESKGMFTQTTFRLPKGKHSSAEVLAVQRKVGEALSTSAKPDELDSLGMKVSVMEMSNY